MPHLKRQQLVIAAAMVSSALFTAHVQAGSYQTITIDGTLSEWASVPVATTAMATSTSDSDPVQLKMANDANYIYFLVNFATPVDPSANGTYLGIDSDNSASTGYNIYNSTQIGANAAYENDYPFTETSGNFNDGGTASNGALTNVTMSDYPAFFTGNTTSYEEYAIPINASENDPDGYQGPLFQTNTNSFTVEFYSSPTTVLGPYTYTIASQPVSKSTYLLTGSGDFAQASSWSAGVPGGAGAEADFLGSITAAHTVYSDTNITLGTIIFNNSYTYVLAGAGALTLQTTSGSALVDVQAGIQKITLPTEIASNTVLQADNSSTLIMGGPITIDPGITLSEAGTGSVEFQSTITVDSGGSISLAANSHAASLALLGTSTASLISETGTTTTALELDSLSLDTNSTFNLKNGALVVQNGSLSGITQSIASGYNAGKTPWAGTGITSSTAAADSTHLTAVGVISNSGISGAAIYSSFGGVAVTANDVLLKYTYYGDTNLDGAVDGTDYSRIDVSYATEQTTGSQISGWFNGDFNYDGVVDGSDYTLMDNAFNSQGAAIQTELSSPAAQATAEIAATSSVPEPATTSMLVLCTAGMLGRRRRVR